MVERIDPPDLVQDAVHFEAWLAERELLTAAVHLRDLASGPGAAASLEEARIGYQAAWLRFMVSLCNLPLAERPVAVDRALDALRSAHALRADGVPPGRTVPTDRADAAGRHRAPDAPLPPNLPLSPGDA